MKMKTMKKIKDELIRGTSEWNDAVKRVAELLDRIDTCIWDIAEDAIRIPDMRGKWDRNGNEESRHSDFSPLQEFAIDVQKETKRYAEWESCYKAISQARVLLKDFTSEKAAEKGKYGDKIHKDLTIYHHAVAAEITSRDVPIRGKTRDEWLNEAREQHWSARELGEKMHPGHWKPEHESVEENYFSFQEGKMKIEDAMNWFEKNGYAGLSQTRIDGMVRGLFILVTSHMPRFIKHIQEEGNAQLDPLFVEMMRKMRGGDNR